MSHFKYIFILLLLAPLCISAQKKKKEKDLLKRNDELLKASRYTEALSDADSLSKLHPANTAVWMRKGFLQLGFSDTTGALESYEKAIQLNPKDMPAYRKKTDIYLAQHKVSPALKEADRALLVSKDYPYFIYVKAGLSHVTHQVIKESEYLNQLLKVAPDWDTTYTARATYFYESLHDSTKAMQIINDCIKRFPASVIAYNTRCNYYINQQQYSKAIDDINELMKLQPENKIQYYIAAARLKFMQGNQNDGCIDLSKAAKMGSMEGLSLVSAYCWDFITDSVEKSNILGFRATQLQNEGKFQEALEAIKQGIQFNPKENYSQYFMKAMLEYRLEKYTDALADIKTAFTDPAEAKKSYPLLLYAQCQRALKNYEEAKIYYQKAVDADPLESRTASEAAYFYYEQKDYATAAKYYEEAIKRNKRDSDLQLQLGEMYLLLNEKEKACRSFSTAKEMGNGKAIAKVIVNCK